MLAFWHDLAVTGDAHALMLGGSLVFASAILYAIYLVAAGPIIGRIGAARFIAWAMLASTVFILLQFASIQDGCDGEEAVGPHNESCWISSPTIGASEVFEVASFE